MVYTILMKKQIALAIVLSAPVFGATQTFTGFITDDSCDKADHKEMNMGPPPECVIECVKGMKGKYLLYDGKTAYVLSDQTTPEKFAAKKVTVTGTLDAKTKTIQVEKIALAK